MTLGQHSLGSGVHPSILNAMPFLGDTYSSVYSAGSYEGYFAVPVDVKGDNKIGIPEVLYISGKISGPR